MSAIVQFYMWEIKVAFKIPIQAAKKGIKAVERTRIW